MSLSLTARSPLTALVRLAARLAAGHDRPDRAAALARLKLASLQAMNA